MDDGGIPTDWKPSPPPDIGSKRWLDDMAFTFVVEQYNGLPRESGVFKLPNVEAGGVSYYMGYFVLFASGTGSDYFRTESIIPVSAAPKFTDSEGRDE